VERIKNLNDEINNIIKTKKEWEKRIIELGGPDYLEE
jgi:pre-mRNA-splicing factor ISY1